MKEKFKSYFFIMIISIIVSIPLFDKNFNIYIDDGIQHVARLIGTYQSITEGQTLPVIMSNFCNGFGYSWNLFYSPITAYIPLLFSLFTSSAILWLKLFILLVTILSGITIYEFINTVTKNKYAGLLGAAFYIFAPYRLTDMYIRMAVAELTSFIFLPMVFQGLYTIFDDEESRSKSGLLLTIGAIGLILSHTVIAMYTAIMSLIYVLIHIIKLKNKKILKQLFISLLLIICVTSFFWAPMLEHKINTQYEVFKPGRMERTDVLVYYKLDLIDLIYTKQGNMIFEIGMVTIIGIVLTILAYPKIEKKYKKLYIFSLIVGIFSIFMTLKWFPFEKLPAILKMLQFSFRMLEFSSFFLSFVVAINYAIVIPKFKGKDVAILFLIILCLSIPYAKHLQYEEETNENRLWAGVPVTEETGRVHAGCASFEYLPSKAFDHLEYIKTRNNGIIVTSGNALIQNEQKSGTKMSFKVLEASENTVLELPYIYYLGYEVKVENNKESIKTYESENGFIEIHLDEINKLKNGQEVEIIVQYTGTTVMKISMVISIISFTMMIIYYGGYFKKYKCKVQ